MILSLSDRSCIRKTQLSSRKAQVLSNVDILVSKSKILFEWIQYKGRLVTVVNK